MAENINSTATEGEIVAEVKSGNQSAKPKTTNMSDLNDVFGIIGLVLGIASLLFSCCAGFFAIPISIVGLGLSGLSYYQKKQNNVNDPIGIAGIVLNLLTILFIVVCYGLLVLFYGSLFLLSV